ncbi:uncharacterized protein KRP23_13277 [Phytophthora ramorum]|uniref:uncharacterized protein n=1 Tax=Phytophthora ramorum TaxID=164328 RepID=UPI0030B1C022|nr:hypothetical protein KRP23_13277 [Phytophthora ramorum]
MELPSRDPIDGPALWTSVAVVYRECLLKRGGELPHVARRIDGFLDGRTSTGSLSAVYARTASLHCMRLLAERRPALETLHRDWEFNDVVAQAAKSGDLSSLKWLAEIYLPGGPLSGAANAAARSGELHILEWLHELHKDRVHWGGVEWGEAIRAGQRDVIEWLQRNALPNEEAIGRLVFDAADAGYLELTQWLLTQDSAAVSAALRGARKEGICLLRDDWEDTELGFVGMGQWLLEMFGEELEGVTFSVNRSDWATNKWVKDHNMRQLDVEDEVIFWECGPADPQQATDS